MAELPSKSSSGDGPPREGHSAIDGKDSRANEIFADESGGAYEDDEVDIERIEKVYRYFLSQLFFFP